MVHDERARLAADLGAVAPAAWSTPSLCPGWDVHDVVAHLIDSATTTRRRFVRRMIAARFDFDRDNDAGIRAQRRADPAATLDALRAVVSSTDSPPAAAATRLVEAFVHGEDIRRPLGIVGAYPTDAVIDALDHQLATSVSFGGGRQRAQGTCLVVTDGDYAHGAGPEVRGRAIDLLLAVSGRPVPDGALTGPGAPHLLVE
ncbi:maleylpyruvate isomerase family mycothiol-dependent enzyme [Gordonia sesuvii]|uniref:maleylpyruvate isomerase family mycothiol-dependent enzyme n=1 Tax=Gordonia sesuvii TaxID=3116777 RepID=UPI003D66F344